MMDTVTCGNVGKEAAMMDMGDWMGGWMGGMGLVGLLVLILLVLGIAALAKYLMN